MERPPEFARADKWLKSMKLKLGMNCHKGNSWEKDHPSALLRRVYEELIELTNAVNERRNVAEVRGEAADVANMAMMVADAYERMVDQVRGTPGGTEGGG